MHCVTYTQLNNPKKFACSALHFIFAILLNSETIWLDNLRSSALFICASTERIYKYSSLSPIHRRPNSTFHYPSSNSVLARSIKTRHLFCRYTRPWLFTRLVALCARRTNHYKRVARPIFPRRPAQQNHQKLAPACLPFFCLVCIISIYIVHQLGLYSRVRATV